MKKEQLIKKSITGLLIGISLLLATACATNSNNSSADERKEAANIRAENQGTENESQLETERAIINNTEYPVTIITYGSDGEAIQTVYEQAPQRVVAVYQGSIETMLALGLEDSLVATAGLDNEVPDEQKGAFSKTNYLDEFTPSLETVTMLAPDLIFSWGSLFGEKTLGNTQDWLSKGVNTYMNANTHPMRNEISYHKTLENEFHDILNIGKIFDVQDVAEAIVRDMKDTIANVEMETANLTQQPTALIIEPSRDSFTNYGATSLGGDMLTTLGGSLANPDALKVGKEDIIAANPDVIFVVYMPYAGDNPEQVKQAKLDIILADEAFASLDAVQNDRVVPIMLSEMYASATRTKDGIITFAKGLYPQLDFDIEESGLEP